MYRINAVVAIISRNTRVNEMQIPLRLFRPKRGEFPYLGKIEGSETMKKRMTKQEREQRRYSRENERRWQAAWKAEGRSLADYKAGLNNFDSEVWKWRRAKGEAAVAAEHADWLRDHPGNPLPEHMCGLNDAQYTVYELWAKQRSARIRHEG